MKFLYGFTILLGAFLLFQIQPLIGKFLLPWFGNTPGVWTTCLVFFQILLLGGYFYAHLISERLRKRPQLLFHGAILLLSLTFLPIIPSETLRPTPSSDPAMGILRVLAISISVPYLVLASTSPLLQHWSSHQKPSQKVWRFYAVSNTGSLLALVSYPFAVEPFLKVKTQFLLWSGGFGVYALMIVLLSVLRWREQSPAQATSKPIPVPHRTGSPVPYGKTLLWLLLSAFPSALLVGTTNRIGQDVPAVPFLFILPLCLYLLTFIIAFDSPRWYSRPIFFVLLLVGIAGGFYEIESNVHLGFITRVTLYSSALFFCCMSCHGELARLKPSSRHLTYFYLIISTGGALGGMFSALLAPQIFQSFVEFPLAMAGCFAVVAWCVSQDVIFRATPDSSIPKAWGIGGIGVSVLTVGILSLFSVLHIRSERVGVVLQSRNFFGVVQVKEQNSEKARLHRYNMLHGEINHGFQFRLPEKRTWKVSYYGNESGLGLAQTYHPLKRDPDQQYRIGVIGLGTGAMAAWANDPEFQKFRPTTKPNDSIQFYEIDSRVVELAETYFSYLEDARGRGAEVDIHLGDARATLDRQIQSDQCQNFDLLAIDAFSGDSIPMHLLTRECVDLYLRHLRPGGIIAFHVSSRYLKLRPVIRALADESGLTMHYIRDKGNNTGCLGSDWALLTANEEFNRIPEIAEKHLNEPAHSPVLWTDDYSSLLTVLQ